MALNKKLNLNFRGTNWIKEAFQQVLQELFANTDVMDERFLYDTDDAKTQIKIYRSFPQRMEFYPCIAISAEPFDGSLTSMGIEGEDATDVQEQGILTKLTYTGHIIIPINLKVFARQSTDDREQITDILFILLRILGARQAFARFGFGYTHININGEDQFVDDDNHMVFTNSITIQCNTDYTYVVDVLTQETIEKIVVRVFGKLNPSDQPYPLFTQP